MRPHGKHRVHVGKNELTVTAAADAASVCFPRGRSPLPRRGVRRVGQPTFGRQRAVPDWPRPELTGIDVFGFTHDTPPVTEQLYYNHRLRQGGERSSRFTTIGRPDAGRPTEGQHMDIAAEFLSGIINAFEANKRLA